MTKSVIKTLALVITALFLAPAGSNAQEISGYPLGYCNGEVTTNAIIKPSEKGEISGAIFIPSSYASTVSGNQIKAVRAGIGSTRNVDNLKVWVRSQLDGANIGSGTATEALKQGWNEVALESPVTITPELVESGFYIGFSFEQSFKSAGLAALSAPSEGGMWVKVCDNAWEDHSSEGTLCIEGLVYGDMLPKINVHIENLTVDKWYIVQRGILNGVITLRNLATETVKEIEIEAKIDGIDAPCSTRVNCNLAYDEVAKIPFTVSPGYVSDDPREISGTFTVTAVNGEADEDVTDNTATVRFFVIDSAYPRKVLVEEYTTESCSNCPRVAGYLHQVLEDPQYASNAEAICHHSGYGRDAYTLMADVEYEWFYSGGSTYAPAMMVDRSYTKYNDTPIFLPGSPEEIADMIDRRLAEPSLISVEVSPEIDGDKVKANVSGKLLDPSGFSANPRLTVYLVEDNIFTSRQAGAGSSFTHMHVTRDLNDTWGVPLVMDASGNYSYSCSFKLYDDYKLNDMKVVAVVSNYNGNDRMDCGVENVGSAPLMDEAGVNAIGVDEENTVIYTIDGRRIREIESSGLYIINGKKVFVRR